MESRCENCIIRQFNSLRAMSKEELKTVSDSKTTKTIKKGQPLFEEGDKLNGVYCVRNGVSKLSKLSANGKDQIVKLATKGEVLGQRSVIAEESTNLSAVAVSDMEVCFIPKESITHTLQRNPNFTLEVLRHMAHDLKEADDVIVNISQKTVKQRVAEAFLYLRNNFGEDKDGFLALTLSREDISNVVGTATESAIRIISEFKKKGLIRTSGKKIGIKDERKLIEMVEGF
ncbi:Crp/Fnr family transcriptional regulator [Flagellimonas taeanensis]|uniref:cAMP-binding domain of CRP or a regulatory subunit of cAMP-dependent protein kinases n=1 Tax=Flagellimonas taeanensis TaxID=1005926 RepID=A0A1M6T9B1_9FLAO|nr:MULTISPECIES: Crp/Fnr family transcriptional regulator [Allomuricauda]MDC6384027.1 Crp/Fnr family transcriptional regulator [Muricauda sp. SK9]RIV48635.1 Crp/Fnr family transcriptional regulator [Allomuricauda taeanensis]SFB86460.1 cAMP-binding domain of CRP or a regulatory subunit of cAMP-dependent protein kinases [Allomuricauda taeanensis]SHK53565.1 cAMP-binding domain of CRP or a regulatory subunit of cAMP-dependent protein kinases [Allomuricauda taeanensis]